MKSSLSTEPLLSLDGTEKGSEKWKQSKCGVTLVQCVQKGQPDEKGYWWQLQKTAPSLKNFDVKLSVSVSPTLKGTDRPLWLSPPPLSSQEKRLWGARCVKVRFYHLNWRAGVCQLERCRVEKSLFHLNNPNVSRSRSLFWKAAFVGCCNIRGLPTFSFPPEERRRRLPHLVLLLSRLPSRGRRIGGALALRVTVAWPIHIIICSVWTDREVYLFSPMGGRGGEELCVMWRDKMLFVSL